MQGSTSQRLSYQETLERVWQHLDASDAASVSVACATLCVLLSQSQEQAALDGLAPKLLKALSSVDSVEAQRNAVAALSAAVEASDSALREALENGAAQCLVGKLQQQGAAGDAGLTLNLLAALGVLAEGSAEGAQAVVEAGGVEQLLAQCSVEQGQQQGQQQQQQQAVLESAVDAVCKLASAGEEPRTAAADKGAIPVLAALLCAGAGLEVQVRCLLALGMLASGNEQRQVQLAAAPGAAAQLVALMRQGDDADCQHIAAGLFAELAKNPAAKESVAAALKAAQQ